MTIRQPRRNTPTECSVCQIPLVPQYRWAALPAEEKVGKASHHGHGMCIRHMARYVRYGDPLAVPEYTPRPPRGSETRSADEVLDEWEMIREGGCSDVRIGAQRMGMSFSALDKALYRARQRGDRRGGRLPYGNDLNEQHSA